MATGQQLDIPAPRPWRVYNINQTYHVEAADGSFVTLFVREADAALIVEAVNAIDATLKLKRTLLGWSMERDRLREELNAEKEVAVETGKQKLDALFEAAKLRDIVRRLEDEFKNLEDIDTVCNTDRARRIEALFREAIGEAQP